MGWEGNLLVGAVAKVVHDDAHLDGLVRLPQDWLLVERHQSNVVKRIKLVHKASLGTRLVLVVHQPTGHVVVEVIRKRVEQRLQNFKKLY